MNDQATAHHEVTAYLRVLEAALGDLPKARRSEIVEEIREHIGEALAEHGDSVGTADVRNVLDRLGEPSEIADEARQRFGLPPQRNVTWLDWSVPLLLSIGSLILFVIGWIIGVVLLWRSRHFRRWEKVMGTAIWPLGMAFPIFLGSFAAGVSAGCKVEMGSSETVCISEGTATSLNLFPGRIVLTMLFLAPVVVAGLLTRRLNRVQRALRG